MLSHNPTRARSSPWIPWMPKWSCGTHWATEKCKTMSRKTVRVTLRLLYQGHRTTHGESPCIWFYSGKNRWELDILLPHILRLCKRLAWVWYLHMGQCEQSRARLLRAIKREKKGGGWASLPSKSECRSPPSWKWQCHQALQWLQRVQAIQNF